MPIHPLQAQRHGPGRGRCALMFALILAGLHGPVASAFAQNRSAVLSRLDRIEQRLSELQAGEGGRPIQAPATGAANLGVGLTALEEQMRQLRGDIERMSFRIDRQQDQITALKESVAMLQERALRWEQKRAQPPQPDLSAKEDTARSAAMPMADLSELPEFSNLQTPADDAAQAQQAQAEDVPTAEAAYKAAFETLNSGNYTAAERLFSKFIATYPQSSLIGNAHYWLGETYYVQEQFDAAADEFRKGFQEMPEGPKAPDNLLRLGMTLGVLERKEEACVILDRLLEKYADQSQAVKRKATHEQEKLTCP